MKHSTIKELEKTHCIIDLDIALSYDFTRGNLKLPSANITVFWEPINKINKSGHDNLRKELIKIIESYPSTVEHIQ